MDASTRLYQRLAEIPEDPEDPESLDDLIVCAFGAFERYYVCWKTKGGDYRQDGYDLPAALKDWLYPSDGTTRDFASLQVVFGRGEEYFASDKNGKLEFKEPEVKKPVEDEDKIDRMALRRSRTVSFLRPLSETSIKSDATSADSLTSRQSRSSSISSQRPSRPPSLSYSRTNSDASMLSRPNSRPLSIVSSHTRAQSSLSSQWDARREDAVENSYSDTIIKTQPINSHEATIQEASATSDAQDVSHHTSWSPRNNQSPQEPATFPETRPLPPPQPPQKAHSPCTCGCLTSQSEQNPRSTYANASVQTDPPPSPPRSALRIDTSTPPLFPSQNGYSAVSLEIETPMMDANPLVVGRSLDYFSKPGYQLGDSLMFGYQEYQPLVYQYQYQDEFGEEVLR
ncbi:hypothetical protein T440DRAFT_506045 [Plenodomus tracheiphilus IPT5]|uniref:Uncharacterized protein n=1 Tax=Plenodomus tracheiphilus IPT5 TaxID=1408161 RepID=A0A6A7BCV4_9PLEO|nr:hypothetical protein T440DRAFT_506045 [Plenodomus tracheiphilus IPT5]